MGNAILVKAGSGGGSGGSGAALSSSTMTILAVNTIYACPAAGNYWITCIGGGGGGGKGWYEDEDGWEYGGGGGGSGYLNQKLVSLSAGEKVQVTIGAGGGWTNNRPGSTGGTTTFGSYLSASGGTGGQSYTYNNNRFGGTGFSDGTRSDKINATKYNIPYGGHIYYGVAVNGKLAFKNTCSYDDVHGAVFPYGAGGYGQWKQNDNKDSTGYGGCVVVEYIN